MGVKQEPVEFFLLYTIATGVHDIVYKSTVIFSSSSLNSMIIEFD